MMVLDVEPVLSAPDCVYEFPVSFEAAALDVPQGHLSVDGPDTFPLSLRFEKGKGLFVSAEADFRITAPCDRCLKDTAVELPVRISHLLPAADAHLTAAGDEAESFVVSAHEIDIDALVADALQLQWPAKVLCRPDCRGLCPVCGQDLNLAECGCDRVVLDPRMAKLKDLFDGLS